MKFPDAPDASSAFDIFKTMAAQDTDCAPRHIDKRLALYGAGNLGKMASEYFSRLEIPFQYVVDAMPDRYDDDAHWTDIEIVGPDDVPAIDRETGLLAVCVSTVPYSELKARLAERGHDNYRCRRPHTSPRENMRCVLGN